MNVCVRSLPIALACAWLAFACRAYVHVPDNTSRAAVSGRPVIGKTLKTSDGGWKYGPTSYSYQWQDCASNSYCTTISGATSKSYTVKAKDFDYALRAKVTACNASGCSSVLSARTAHVTAHPSGIPLPPNRQTDSFGTAWREIGEDDFTVSAPLGSWGTSDANEVVYTGDHGLQWDEYPDGWPCGAFSHCYRPADVVSVHDGVLDYWLHNCRYPDGVVAACGADPGPLIPTTDTRYQTYGRYEARFKLVFDDRSHLDQYHIAWLLWREHGSDRKCAEPSESDFPEMDLSQTTVSAFAHRGCKHPPDYFNAKINLTKWHTFTQEWGPGFRRYYLDGRLLGQSTNEVYSGPERWQLQTEAHRKAGDTTSGHLLVDWVWIGALSRAAP